MFCIKLFLVLKFSIDIFIFYREYFEMDRDYNEIITLLKEIPGRIVQIRQIKLFLFQFREENSFFFFINKYFIKIFKKQENAVKNKRFYIS